MKKLGLQEGKRKDSRAAGEERMWSGHAAKKHQNAIKPFGGQGSKEGLKRRPRKICRAWQGGR